jgi:hypothetical protein
MRKELTTVGFCERDIKTMKAFDIGEQMATLFTTRKRLISSAAGMTWRF